MSNVVETKAISNQFRISNCGKKQLFKNEKKKKKTKRELNAIQFHISVDKLANKLFVSETKFNSRIIDFRRKRSRNNLKTQNSKRKLKIKKKMWKLFVLLTVGIAIVSQRQTLKNNKKKKVADNLKTKKKIVLRAQPTVSDVRM